MSIDVLKQELSTLDAKSRRLVMAFLVSLQDAQDETRRRKLEGKIGQPASEFATLEELDRRLGLRATDDDQ